MATSIELIYKTRRIADTDPASMLCQHAVSARCASMPNPDRRQALPLTGAETVWLRALTTCAGTGV